MKNMMLWIVLIMAICNQQLLASEHVEKDNDMKIDIVVSAKAQEPVKFAASELSSYLGRITGGQPSVVEDGKGVFLVAVSTEESVPAGIRERLKGHGAEAFVVESDGERLLLVGNSPRAVVYAVYDFLEKHLGCRWYTPDPAEDIVPRCPVADIRNMLKAGIHDLEKPDFSVRMWQYLIYHMGYGKTPLTEEVMLRLPDIVAWMPKLRLNILQLNIGTAIPNYPWDEFKKVIPELRRRGLEAGIGEHCQNIFMDNKKLKENPDWQVFYDGVRHKEGQFCASNKDAVEYYLNNMVSFLKANPEITWFAPYPNDGGKWCECLQCIGTPVVDRLMRLEKLVFKRLKKETPNVRYSCFAYEKYMMPPTEEEKILPGMTATLCTWGRNYGIPFDDDRTCKSFRSAFSGWRDVCRKANAPLVLHEKFARLMYMGPHFLPLPVLEQDMRFYRKEGAAGFELPCAYMGWWAKSLNWTALSRLMWNADTSVKDVTDDFFARFYGPCSNEAARIYALVESGSDYKYGGNKGLFGKKAGEDCSVLRPFYERAVKQFEQARKETQALRLQFKENADLSYRLGHLQIVLDYCFDEFNVIQEIVMGADDALCAKKNISDQVLYQSQIAEARRHFESAGRLFDLVQQRYYADPKGFGLIWDLGAGSNGKFDKVIAEWLSLLDCKDVNGIDWNVQASNDGYYFIGKTVYMALEYPAGGEFIK